MKNHNKVTVTVTGPTGSGKTAIAVAIKEALAIYNIHAECVDLDSNDVDDVINPYDRFNVLKVYKPEVRIEEKNLPRESIPHNTTLNTENNICETCHHWSKVSSINGNCKRFPPHPTEGFPRTSKTDKCGEWTSKSK